MDRRGHGESKDESEAGSNYGLRKEFEDVAAVVNSQAGPVFVLGHSIGGLFALEAAFLTNKISKLVLYEPPLQDLDHTAVADRMERMIHADVLQSAREQALVTFLREIVMISPDEIAAMKRQAAWPSRVAGIDIQIREIRALSKYRFEAKRMKRIVALVSGGGFPMGQVIGSTNARGEHPKERPLTPQDLLATIYRHLGIDYRATFQNFSGRPVPILGEGQPISELT